MRTFVHAFKEEICGKSENLFAFPAKTADNRSIEALFALTSLVLNLFSPLFYALREQKFNLPVKRTEIVLRPTHKLVIKRRRNSERHLFFCSVIPVHQYIDPELTMG